VAKEAHSKAVRTREGVAAMNKNQTERPTASKGDKTPLGAALERDKQFNAELETADDAMKPQLVAAYKELIIEQLVKFLQVTNDPHTLGFLDINIAVGHQTAGRFSEREK
jgi:hypothetical protein